MKTGVLDEVRDCHHMAPETRQDIGDTFYSKKGNKVLRVGLEI